MKTWTLKRDDTTLTIKLSKVDFIEHFPYGIYDMEHFDEKGKKARCFVVDYIFGNVGYSDSKSTFREACKLVSESISSYIRCGYDLVIGKN